MLRQVPEATTAALPEPPARAAPGAGPPPGAEQGAPTTQRGRAGERGARWYAGARCCSAFHPCGRGVRCTRRRARREPPASRQDHVWPYPDARPAGVGPAWRAGGGSPRSHQIKEIEQGILRCEPDRRAPRSGVRAAASPTQAATSPRDGANGVRRLDAGSARGRPQPCAAGSSALLVRQPG